MHINAHSLKLSPNSPIKKYYEKSINNLEDKIKETLTTLTKRTEYEVPEYGRLFKPIEEEITNPNAASVANRIKFSVKPSTEKENQTGRILKMEIFSKQGNSISPIFECGTKDEILKKLTDENLPEKIKDFITKANPILLKRNME